MHGLLDSLRLSTPGCPGLWTYWNLRLAKGFAAPGIVSRLSSVLGMAATLVAAEPLELGTRRELFVDRFLIERLEGAELRLHHPQPAGIVFRFDQPWEGIVSGYVTVLHEPGKFHLYYRGRPTASQRDASAEAREVACYAQSADGIYWTRPDLGLFEVHGTRRNNVILTEPKSVTHNFCPFLDTRPGVPAAERFKGVGGTGAGGLFGFLSSDGIRWRPATERALITQGAFDSQNVVFWSAAEERYLCYFRTWKNQARWIARSTSTNFLDWTEPVDMSFGDAPIEHLYINQTQPYFRAPQIYLATAARFNPGRRALTDEQVAALDLDHPRNYAGLKGDCSDAVLLSSRGGHVYERTFLESFVRPGLDLRNWGARANYPALGVVPTGPSEISLYVLRHYGQPTIHLERLTLRPDGFASVQASYRGGELLTKAVRFSGQDLELNCSTSAAGGLRVEVLEPSGTPIPGYRIEDCPEIIGDQLDRVVRWQGGHSVRPLAGRPVRLRIVLKDADLYSLRFRD